MLVYLKGYEIKKITKNMLKKEEFGASLSEVVSTEQLKEEIREVLENGGFVYGLYKKKEMTICYLIERRTGEEPEEENVDVPFSKDKLHKNDILSLTREYVLPGHEEAVAKFDEAVREELKERIYFFGDAARIEFKDQVLTEKSYRVGGFHIGGAMMGFAIGILFGIALNNFALGLCFALAFASSYGISLGGRRK